MSNRPTALRRRTLALLVLSFAMALGPAAAVQGRSPDPGGGSGFHPRPIVRTHTTGSHLRGRLPALIEASRSAHLRGTVLSGLVTSDGVDGPAVAVAFRLLDPSAASGSTARTNPAIAALVAAGARIANRDGDRIEAYLPAPALQLLATLPGIADAAPIIRPVPLGPVGIGTVGQGIPIQGADAWQTAGITGNGVKVGIIDGGFVGLTGLLGRELPASVKVHCYQGLGIYSTAATDCETDTAHGTAVAETVSDMAPGASLYLSNPISIQDFAAAVAWMTSNGVKIINVSLGFAYEGPGDGTGPAGTMYGVVDQAVKGGALWVNAAGNSGEDGWVGPWQDADGNDLLDFAPGDEGNAIALQAGDGMLVSLRWNDVWGKAADDYDLFIYGPGGGAPLASSEDEQSGTQDPVETLGFVAQTGGTYRLAIGHSGGKAVSRLQLLVITESDAALQYMTLDNTLPTPADSRNAGAIAVGAVGFDQPSVVETFSSRGPTVDNRIKPDFVAVDCATTASIGHFCGTSQAAPHAAGAAALVLEAKPKLTPAQLADFLRSHTDPLGSPIPNNVSGTGRLNLGPPPQPPTPTSIAFSKAPLVGEAGVAFQPQPVVQILDQDGALITVGPGATTSVTLRLGTNPGTATLDCTGGLTVPAVAGVAAFTGCSISAPGTGYTLTASLAGVPDLSTAPLNIFPPGQGPPTPALTIASKLATVTYGTTVTLTVAVGVPAGGPPAAGRSITIQSSPNGTAWATIGTVTTGTTGVATKTYKPSANMRFRAVFDGAVDLMPATSSSVKVAVRELITLRPTNGGKVRSVTASQEIIFTGTVRPTQAGVAGAKVTFRASLLVGSKWVVISTRVVQTDSAGQARVIMRFGSAGTWSVEAMASSTAANASSVWSPRERFKVR